MSVLRLPMLYNTLITSTCIDIMIHADIVDGFLVPGLVTAFVTRTESHPRSYPEVSMLQFIALSSESGYIPLLLTR